jgi:hypothetical protein
MDNDEPYAREPPKYSSEWSSEPCEEAQTFFEPI